MEGKQQARAMAEIKKVMRAMAKSQKKMIEPLEPARNHGKQKPVATPKSQKKLRRMMDFLNYSLRRMSLDKVRAQAAQVTVKSKAVNVSKKSAYYDLPNNEEIHDMMRSPGDDSEEE